ncbi:uncharacterized protein VNE69_02201 [Vairimorpha necatrix]|uniref:Uncharacterized protein n=1 Tax=Vairimorpha necatrix TaxID=6039 RepID=A0AAX4J9R1_9MICR
MLEINNMTFYIEEQIICTNQKFKVHGVCGIMGRYNLLRECFISEFTASLFKKIPLLSAHMKIYYKNEEIKYKFSKCLLNPYTFFNVEDKVEDIFYFVNKKLADEVIKDFDLGEYRKLCIGELGPSVSNILEMAIAACSGSKVAYCYEILDPYKSTEFYLRLLKKYSVLNESIIFVETQSFDKHLFDSFIVFHDKTISSYNKEIDSLTGNICNIKNYESFVYETYVSKFNNIPNGNYYEYEDSTTDNDSCITSLDSSSSVSTEDNSNVENFLQMIIYKCKIWSSFIQFCKSITPDLSKALTLVTLKFNRPEISNELSIYYTNVGNITMIIFCCKHWFSLHFLFLQIYCWILIYHLSVKNTDYTVLSLISKFTILPKWLKKFEKIFDFFTLLIFLKYLIFFETHCISQFYNIFKTEYIKKMPQTSLISSIIYTCVFYSSNYLIDEDYTFIRKYHGVAFNSSTVYFYFIFYSFISSIFPFILVSIILNIYDILIVLLNCQFNIPLFNYFMAKKSKFLISVYLITRNYFAVKESEVVKYPRYYKFLKSFDMYEIAKNLSENKMDKHSLILLTLENIEQNIVSKFKKLHHENLSS